MSLTLEEVLANPTKQNIFDFVVDKLRQQGKQSWIPESERSMGVDGEPEINGCSDNGCRYRLPTPDGVLKCALGHLIPDEIYTEKMEGKSISAVEMLPLRHYFGDDALFGAHIVNIIKSRNYMFNFLNELQGIHDNYWDIRELKWATLAKNENLAFTPVS